MKTRGWKIKDGGWNMRSVLSVSASLRRDRAEARGEGGECGGKRNATPLSEAIGSVEKLRRRCALPEQSKTRRIFGVAMIFLAIAISAHAQGYSIDWFKIAEGGGTSTNGQYSISGTTGQPDASGAMTGGNYSLTGGFWSLISVVQTIGAPTLLISHSGNTATVYWQDVAGWSLQQNNTLALPANWSASGGVTNTNGTNYLNIISPTGNLFFRLSKP